MAAHEVGFMLGGATGLGIVDDGLLGEELTELLRVSELVDEEEREACVGDFVREADFYDTVCILYVRIPIPSLVSHFA
jgi:hypothetical protein